MQTKNKQAQFSQILLVLLLMALPLFYFFQKFNYIRSDMYTDTMTAVSEQIGGKLERQVIWEDSKDENKSSMMYTAYYYPQALSVVCRTTPVTYVRDGNTPPGVAYLISDEGMLYPAKTVEDTEYNTTLLVFENVPSDFIGRLRYLDIVPEQSVPEDGLYRPSDPVSGRIRYTLQSDTV